MSKFSMSKWDDFGSHATAASAAGTLLYIVRGLAISFWSVKNDARRVREVNGDASSVEQAKRLCAAAARYIESSPIVRGR